MTSVMPKPPAAFSPLTTTRSSFHPDTRPGRRSFTAARPERPTTSPMKKIIIRLLFAEIDRFALGQNEVELFIAIGGGDKRNFLRCESYSDRDDRFTAAQAVDRHIVIACAES